MDELLRQGWTRFDAEPQLTDWARHADVVARAAEADPANGEWRRCGGTWFVGVNVLPNDAQGRLPGGPPLSGRAITAARNIADIPLDRAQASVCYPGYPAKGPEEDAAAFRYRRRRDAAHVDGLHRVMPGRRRVLRERHAYILGVALNDPPADAAPLVVWRGSHEVMRAAFRAAFAGARPEDWAKLDVTEAYQEARRQCFETLERVEIPARAGDAYLIHRLALHGVAPWGGAAEGRRAIGYFRPEAPGADATDWWVTAP